MNDLAAAIRAQAQRLGISPLDLGTVISYETAGTFDPWKAGPTTQWGQHRGLIQWGEPQRAKYGVTQSTPVPAQMNAVGNYLFDAGVRPGMGILDVYSAINAGKVGRYNASDANNGGAPGTVRDKVQNQMAAHRAKAASLLADKFSAAAPGGNNAAPAAGAAPTPAAPWNPGAFVPNAPNPMALASMFMQQQAAQQQQAAAQKQQEAETERQRRVALLSQVGSMFG